MPNFRYRALTQGGEMVSGLISAATTAEVARRIEYLRLFPIDTVPDDAGTRASRFNFTFAASARPEDVTIFTLDLALVLKAGARLDEALELLATDIDIGRLRSTVAKIRASVIAGESFADALSHHPALFSTMYVALVRIGETSGTLERILELLASERSRAEALRRKLGDALRYPAFLLFAATCVLIFFLMFVMPQFGGVLRDFGAKLGPIAAFFLGVSEFMTQHKQALGLLLVVLLLAGFLLGRRPSVRATILSGLSHVPLARSALAYHRTALFCRNLGVLLAAGVPRDVIIADYAITNHYRRDITHLLSKSVSKATLDTFTSANPRYIEAALDELDSRFGSTAAWLESLGLGPSDQLQLRDLLIE